MPPIIGYLLVGMLIGPHALALVPSTEAVTHLAEFGVVFLMFSLGLEFNLAKLNAMRRIVFGLGAAQVGAVVVLAILTGWGFGLSLPGGNLLVGGGGWCDQDRQGIDAGRKAGGAHQQMASQQQGQGFALHDCLGR